MYVFYSKLPKNIMSSEITQNDKSSDQFSEVNEKKDEMIKYYKYEKI